MPAQRPRASFEPIAPDFDLRELVENTENFQYVDRISCETIEEQGLENFEKLILLHVVIGGKPLVVDGFEERLDPWTFTPKWLKDNHGEKVENARNLMAQDNLPLTIGHYLKNLGKLTDQYFDKANNYKDKSRQRMYLKDIDCPSVWQEKLREQIPASLFYWNDSTGEVGGPGAVDETIPNGSGRRMGKGIASAGDLMSSLPVDMRAENLMCYIGHEGTYTPAHREMCASLGQNIMVHASEAFNEDGQPQKPGSSIWFMTESKDRHTVAEYWLSVLGHDIEVENHFAQMVAWQRAPFKVYVVEQKAGDFILIPPLAPHQVWNRGTCTMKVAWNRTTVETIELAMKEALPNARMVCRDEQYKNKAIVYYTLLKYSALLKSARMQSSRSEFDARAINSSKKVRQVQKDFKRLFDLYKNIMLSESFAPGTKEKCEFLEFDSNVTCAYCRGNVFNRFLSCKTCMDMLNTGTDEPYDVCMDCFTMGRSCACQSKYMWVEQFKWKDLLARYEEWRKQIIEIDGGTTGKTPLALDQERELYSKRTIAQVCQEQLKKRPWVDIKKPKPDSEEDLEEDIQVNEDGTVKKAVKKRSKSWFDNNKTCHVCCGRHPKWMMAICTMCERGWCYGSLWRGHDLMPQDVMQDPSWECPHCRRVCSTGACRKDKRQTPYEPKGTLLGHDTKKVADVRSVEALVDFSVSNLNWIRESVAAAPQSNKRLQRTAEEAERAKLHDPTLDERYADGDEDEGIVLNDERAQIEYSPVNQDEMIDPALGGARRTWHSENQLDQSMQDVSMAMPAANFMNTSGSYPDPVFGNNGYIAPSAVMYQPAEPEVGGDEALFSNSTFSMLHEKRSRPSDGEQIKLVTSKKRKTVEEERPPPKNKASKQYLQMQEAKRLEEAKKAGRFIQVLASIRGRRKIVVLNLSRDKLAGFAQREASRARTGLAQGVTPPIVLQSDVVPPITSTTSANGPAGSGKSTKHFKIRVEDDEDFHSAERTNRGTKSKKPRFEEITVESDGETDLEGSGAAPVYPRKDGRQSNWLARKRQGEEDLPDELPPNFRDGHARPNREQLLQKERERRERRTTLPPRVQAQKALKTGQVRASTGRIGVDFTEIDAPGDATDGAVQSSSKGQDLTLLNAAQAAVEIARAAEVEEDNRRAKLEAASFAADYVSSDEGEFDEEEKADANLPTKGGPAARAGSAKKKKGRKSTDKGPPSRQSMFSRPGMAGRKIKIVGAASSSAAGPISGKSNDLVPTRSVQPADVVDPSLDGMFGSSSEVVITPDIPRRKGPPGRKSLPSVSVNRKQ